MDKAWNYFLRFIFYSVDNMTGRLIPQVHEIASNPEPVKEIGQRVSNVSKVISFIVFGIIVTLIVYAIKNLVQTFKSKKR
jgi:hypothetical protein